MRALSTIETKMHSTSSRSQSEEIPSKPHWEFLQTSAPASERQVSSCASGDQDSLPKDQKPHLWEKSHQPENEETSQEFEYIDFVEYGFLCLNDKDQRDVLEDDSCTKPSECTDVPECVTDPQVDPRIQPRTTDDNTDNLGLDQDQIPSKIQDYTVLEILGEGVFGKVAKCFNPKTGKVVALKILKDDQDDFVREVKILQRLNVSQPDKVNIVKLIDYFTWGKFKCMAFEMLDCSLLDLFKQGKCPLSLCEIRPIAQQLLVAFEVLRKAEVIHTDLKLDNIMLVNHKAKPFKVRLIDFGCGGYKSELKVGMMMQAAAYRAPEVTLGLPLSEAVDMWSLGCCLAESFLGDYLFTGNTSYDNLRNVMHLEEPSDEMLNEGVYTDRYFVPSNGSRQWRFKSPIEYQIRNGKSPDMSDSTFEEDSWLDKVIGSYAAKAEGDEHLDLMSFLGLLKQLLQIDPRKRVTSREALQHPFITMDQLSDSQYAERARAMMALSLKDSTPAPPVEDTQLLQTSALASERQVSSWASEDRNHLPQVQKPIPSEMSQKPETEETLKEFQYIDFVEYSFLCLNDKGQCDVPEDDCCTRPSECTDVSESITNLQIDPRIQPYTTEPNTEDPGLPQDQHESCYIEIDPYIEPDADVEPRRNEERRAANPDYVVVEMGDCSDHGRKGSDAADSRLCNSWSMWSACKGLAFSGLVAVQTTACYMFTGSPVVAGVVALPMLLYGCVDVLTTALSQRPQSSTSRGH